MPSSGGAGQITPGGEGDAGEGDGGGGSGAVAAPGGDGEFPLGAGTLTAAELAEIQAIADKYNTTIDIVGSRAAGNGNNIDTDLPVGGDPDTQRSDIDFRIQANHRRANEIISDLRKVGNGAGRANKKFAIGNPPTEPPFIRIAPGKPPVRIK
jgi:hypothetical protein